MALSKLHTDWVFGSYENDAAAFITKGEGYKASAYFDGSVPLAGSIAIGVGYDLIQNSLSLSQIATDFANAAISITAPNFEEPRSIAYSQFAKPRNK